MNLGTFRLVDNDITACDLEYILDRIRKSRISKRKLIISPLASYTLTMARLNTNLRTVLANYDYLLPDSQWIKRFLNVFYNAKISKTITGTDLLLSVCDFANNHGYRIFLYGTAKPTLLKLIDKLRKDYPNLVISGTMPSIFRILTYSEKKDLCSQIDKSDADILFIALGSPLQELFAYDLLNRRPCIKKPVVAIPVGAAFDFISGVKPKAPVWMQQLGFEWFHRFMCEPRRLWKRYLVYGPLFIWFVIYVRFRSHKKDN